ncbi:MAG TPA: ABC transporter substrate binding protein [Acidobacteriota bacterium]|nr:ABC transporter substrate binding protein [Acidobacteriota bacterium]
MLHRRFINYWLVTLLACPLLFAPVQAQTVIGFVLDGPWERNQEARRQIQARIEEALGKPNVAFPAAKRVTGSWTKSSVARAFNRLIEDPDVDLVITLGLLSSHEAVSRGPMPKPVIASRVVGSGILDVPSKDSSAGRVSGVQNLTYITLEDLDLRRSIIEFQKFKRFRKASILVSEAFKDLTPNLEGILQEELAKSGVTDSQVVFVGNSVAPAVSAITPNTQAVILTLLPQLDPEDYASLLGVLRNRRMPVFSVGGNIFAQLGALAGWGPTDAVDEFAARIASNVERILNGDEAGELPVELSVEPRLAINVETAGVLGIGLSDEWQDALLVFKTLDLGTGSPSMMGMSDQVPTAAPRVSPQRLTPEQVKREQAKTAAEIRKRIFKLRNFSAFDAVSPKLVGVDEIVLLGYVYKPGLKRDLENTVGSIKRIDTVDNQIEVLPPSLDDDEIRVEVFKAIYGHPSLKQYLPEGSKAGAFGDNVAVSVDGEFFPRGPHPIQILVKGGNVALIGRVSSASHRQIADTQAKSVPGVSSVETYLRVVSK